MNCCAVGLLVPPYALRARVRSMGPTAIPWLLAELEREPDHWFWALKSITMVTRLRPKIGETLKKCPKPGSSGVGSEATHRRRMGLEDL